MKSEYSKLELKLEKKRKIISLFFTLLFHFFFLFLLIISGAFKINKEEKIKVINVQLHDKIVEEFNKLEESKKRQFLQKGKKSYENIRKKEQKFKEKEIVKRELDKKETLDKNLISEDEIYDNYKKKFEEENKKIEEDFFQNNKNKTSQDKNIDIDSLFAYNIDEGNSSKNEDKNEKDGKKEGNIKWEEGRVRRIVYKDKIQAPEEISEKGLKVNLTIKFTVNNNGFVENAVILESSGNIIWDTHIIEEFKKKYIFEQAPFSSIGILEISINY